MPETTSELTLAIQGEIVKKLLAPDLPAIKAALAAGITPSELAKLTLKLRGQLKGYDRPLTAYIESLAG